MKQKPENIIMDFELFFEQDGEYFKRTTGIIRRRVYYSKTGGSYIRFRGNRIQIPPPNMPFIKKVNVVVPEGYSLDKICPVNK